MLGVLGIEEPGECAVRGDIVDIFPFAGVPARVDLDGSRIDSIRAIDLGTMGSDRALSRLDLFRQMAVITGADDGVATTLIDRLDTTWNMVIDDLAEVHEQARSYLARVADPTGLVTLDELLVAGQERTGGMVSMSTPDGTGTASLPIRRLPPFPEEPTEAFQLLGTYACDGDVVVCCRTSGDAARCAELVGAVVSTEQQARIHVEWIDLPHGFQWTPSATKNLTIVAYDELLHRAYIRRRRHASAEARPLDAFIDMESGDFVVHRDHGIAQFIGCMSWLEATDPKRSF